MKLRFLSDCVSWPRNRVRELCDMIQSNRRISRRTFMANVDTTQLREIERQLGYESHHSQGLVMANDYCVSYHKSKLAGKTVYYFCHSAIEYVFASGQIFLTKLALRYSHRVSIIML